MRYLLLFLVLALPLKLFAQERNDRDFLVTFLEDSLSSAGREVRIEGFRGAFSSNARLDKLTIADENGIWLTFRTVNLKWNRSALLSGQLEIDEMSAAEILLPRLPTKIRDGPDMAASGFDLTQVPELPVSIQIGSLRAERIVLGAPVLGQEAVLRVQADGTLAQGTLAATLRLDRLDGQKAQIALVLALSNLNKSLKISLSVTEEKGGLIGTRLGIPDSPSLALAVEGNAPIDDFTAQIDLKTDGIDRLKGAVNLRRSTETEAQSSPPLLFSADVSGDIAPLFLPRYRRFFGASVALRVRGERAGSGAFAISELSLETRSLDITGTLVLAADRRPERFDLAITLDDPEGDAVLLPLLGPETRVAAADLRATFDQSRGNVWGIAGTVEQLSRNGFTMDRAIFDGEGVINQNVPAAGNARITATLSGLSHTDRRVSSALGAEVELTGQIGWTLGGAVELDAVTLVTQTATARVEGTLLATGGDLTLAGRMDLSSSDLSVFAGMAGRALAGRADLRLEGGGRILGGIFDVTIQGDTFDLAIGDSRFDPLFAGPANLDLSIERDQSGTRIQTGALITQTLDVSGSADLKTDAGVFDLSARLEDAARFVPVLRGPVALTVAGAGRDRVWSIEGSLNAPGTLRTTVTAEIPLDGKISARVGTMIDTFQSVIPELPGAADATVDLLQTDDGWWVEALVNGPGGIRAVMDGSVTAKADTAALRIAGTAPLALANRALAPRSLTGQAVFDLRLEGPLALSSLRGTTTIRGARLSLPILRNAMEGITGRITLTGGLATYDLSSSLLFGGNVNASGSSALTSPYASDIDLRIDNAVVRDPRLYSSRIDGLIRILGPLAGGARIVGDIVLDETEIQIPSIGFVTGGAVDNVRHVKEPRPVYRTRVRAGLVQSGKSANSASATSFPIDISLRAPNRIFIRGRGLDAELGGQLRLGGTTANVIPSGQLSLLRGRLDILGKRLTLEEGAAQIQGDFVPLVHLVAQSEADGVIIRIIVSGPVSQPDIVFTSIPELPEDEVLSRLLFGRGLTSLSPLQAAQIASAVATLTGRDGSGLIGSLRQGFGLDALDIEADETGRARVRIGEYLSDNLYTDVTIDERGTSTIHLHLDVGPNVTIKGRAGSDGDTGIGLFFERDY